MPQPQFDLLRRYGGSVERLATAIRADPAVRAEIVAELAALRPLERAGRSESSREYAQALRRAMLSAYPKWDATEPGGAQSNNSGYTSRTLRVGSYTIEEDAVGNLNVVAADGATIPLVRKE